MFIIVIPCQWCQSRQHPIDTSHQCPLAGTFKRNIVINKCIVFGLSTNALLILMRYGCLLGITLSSMSMINDC
ncbi:hypothetical protein K439DRAFT_1202423 [Ramaria rubella]|nr:hypothetical protein K439DRAFT_1202423 [Ramaria rubella]